MSGTTTYVRFQSTERDPRGHFPGVFALRAVPQSLPDQRAASDAVHRKAEGRPHTGCIRAFRQRGEAP